MRRLLADKTVVKRLIAAMRRRFAADTRPPETEREIAEWAMR
jgi:hypothetical protein